MNDVIITGVSHGETARTAHLGEREPGVREGRPRVQAAEGRRVARCRHSLQVRHQGQQGRASPDERRCPAKTARSASTRRISVAIVLQQTEQWAAADEIYRTVLEAAPDHADALHFSGVLAHQQARSEQAVALIERSLELEPERADWHSNLGIVLQDRLELDDAIAAYRARDRARSAITPTRTTTSAWCCGRRASWSKPKRRIAPPSASIPSTRTRTTTSASC